MTTPTEFVLWLNGATGVMSGPPTEEQWAVIKDKLGEAIGGIAAKRLLERVEDQIAKDRLDATRRAEAAAKQAEEFRYMSDELRYRGMVDPRRMVGQGYATSQAGPQGEVLKVDLPNRFIGSALHGLK